LVQARLKYVEAVSPIRVDGAGTLVAVPS